MPDLKPGDEGYVAPPDPAKELEEVKAELKGVKETADLQAEQINLYKANQPAATPVEPGEPPQPVEFKGLQDDDVITVGELKKIMGGQDQRYGGIVTELEFKTQHADFDAVIQKYLPGVIKGRPDLKGAMGTSGNPALLAYELVTKCPEYIKDVAEGKLTDAEREAAAAAAKIAANAIKPGSASVVPGGGAGAGGVDFILKMSDDDLESRIADVKSKEK